LKTAGVLNRYAHRYAIERDYLYLKDRLGAADFRQRSLEGINKYLTICLLALTYLQWRQVQLPEARSLADVRRQHQQEHTINLIVNVCKMVSKYKAVQPVLAALGLALPTT